MVNYDLPWNPNRLERRFPGGYTASARPRSPALLESGRQGKAARRSISGSWRSWTKNGALGGQVFDILGQLTFDSRPLRELLLEAVRYGDLPEGPCRLTQVVEEIR